MTITQKRLHKKEKIIQQIVYADLNIRNAKYLDIINKKNILSIKKDMIYVKHFYMT